MGKKFVISIRFHAEGVEADLYRRIQNGKQKAGLSAPEYVKEILSEYFREGKKRNEAEQVLQEIREEYRDMIGCVERTICHSIQEHDAILIGALHKMGGTAVSGDAISTKQDTAQLPKESRDIPKEALNFLEGF